MFCLLILDFWSLWSKCKTGDAKKSKEMNELPKMGMKLLTQKVFSRCGKLSAVIKKTLGSASMSSNHMR